VVSAAILFDALDLSITQIALPSIGRDLRLGAQALPWVANAYVLTYGGLLLFGGRIADVVGRRRAFVAGLAVFGAMSLVCGLAPNGAVLVGARGLQGVGAALTVPASVAIIATTFAEGEERNRALGVFGASASAGFAAGLVLGGVLTEALGWRWIFLTKAPLVLAVALLALRAVAPDAKRARSGGYDLPGAVSGSLGLLLMVFAITQVAARSVPGPLVLTAAALAPALLAFFAWHERRAADPLLPLDFFVLRTPRCADLASLTVLAAPFGFSYVSTLFLQRIQHHGALAAGLALLPGAALSALVSRAVAPRLIARVGLRSAAAGSMVVVAAGFALLLRMSADVSYASMMLPAGIVCLGLGMGIAYPVFTVAAVSDVPDERQGLAAGIQSTALQVGGGFGLAVVSVVVAAGRADVAALRAATLAGCLLPLIGAAVAVRGLPSARDA
jgi:EmrB/QacA subfamily drug resistance transporter